MSRQPQPGPQRPDKYPIAPGPKYQYYGEQPGWVYDPYNDTYHPDPQESKEYYEDTGLVEKEEEPPGVGETLGATAGTVLTIWGAKKGAEYLVGDSGTGIGDTPTGDGGGGNVSPQPTPDTNTAPNVSQPTTGAENPGMMGGGSSSAPNMSVDPGAGGGSGVAQTQGENIEWNAAGSEASGYDVTLTLEDGSVVPAESPQGQAALKSGEKVGVDVKEGGSYQNAQTALYAAGAILGAYNAYKMYEDGDYVGAGLSAGGAGLSGYNAYASMSGGATVPMWWTLPAWAIYKGGKAAYELNKQGVKPGDYTEDEYHSVFHPDMFGEQKLEKYDSEADIIGAEIGLHDELGGPITFFSKGISPMGKFDPLSKLFKSGKNDNQIMRDRLRDSFTEMANVMGEEGGVRGFRFNEETGSHEMMLADGSWYDIGRDGQSEFTGFDGKTKIKHGYEVDTSHPLHHLAAGLLNPLMTGVMHGKDGPGQDIIAQLINGSLSNIEGGSLQDLEKLLQNVRQVYISMGMTDKEVAYQVTEALLAEGKISEEEARAYQNSLNAVFSSEDDPYPTEELLAIENPGNFYGEQQGVVEGETKPPETGEGLPEPPVQTVTPVDAPFGEQQSLEQPGQAPAQDAPQAVERPTPESRPGMMNTRSANQPQQSEEQMPQEQAPQEQPGIQLPPGDIRQRFVDNPDTFFGSYDVNQTRQNPGMMGQATPQVSQEQMQDVNQANVPGQIESQMSNLPEQGQPQQGPEHGAGMNVPGAPGPQPMTREWKYPNQAPTNNDVIKDYISAAMPPAYQPQQPQAPGQNPGMMAPQRSKTRSPGIDMYGNRIRY